MQHLNIQRQTQNRVMAVFGASAISFDFAPAATLEDLAERLADLGDRHDETLISLAVRFRDRSGKRQLTAPAQRMAARKFAGSPAQ